MKQPESTVGNFLRQEIEKFGDGILGADPAAKDPSEYQCKGDGNEQREEERAVCRQCGDDHLETAQRVRHPERSDGKGIEAPGENRYPLSVQDWNCNDNDKGEGLEEPSQKLYSQIATPVLPLWPRGRRDRHFRICRSRRTSFRTRRASAHYQSLSPHRRWDNSGNSFCR